MTTPGPDAELAGWLSSIVELVEDEEARADPAVAVEGLSPTPAGARLYREVLDQLDDSVVAFSGDDRFLLGNDAYRRRFPHLPPNSELAGRTFTQILEYALEAGSIIEKQAVEDPAAYLARRVAQLHQPDGTRAERLTPSGSWDLMRIRMTPDGCRLSIRTDITEQKRAQEDLRVTLERLEAEGAQRAAFIAKLSHELRTPLTAILGYAGMIEGEVIGPLGPRRYREYAASIVQAGQRLLDFIDQILHLSRLEAGRMDMAETAIDLVDTLRREITVVEPLARDNRTILALQLPSGFPALRGDPRLVRQMILTLLSNAVRLTQRGTVSVSLGRRGDGGIDLRVADNGAGMTPELLARAGDPYLAAPATPSGEGGAGLGLALVKELVGLHQGQLLIASEPGRTVATLSFPPERTMSVGHAS